MDASRVIRVRGQTALGVLVEGSNLSGAVFDNVIASGLRIAKSMLAGASISECDLSNVTVVESNFVGATIDGKLLSMALAATTGEQNKEKRAKAFGTQVADQLSFDPAAYNDTHLGEVAEKLCLNWNDSVWHFLDKQTAGVCGEVADCWQSMDKASRSAVAIYQAKLQISPSRSLTWNYSGRDFLATLATLVVLTAMLDMVLEIHPQAVP